MSPLSLCSFLLVVQLLLVVPVRSSSAPWPTFGHDSSLSYTAPDDVGVYSFYSAATLPLLVNTMDPTYVFIPAEGIYVSVTWSNTVTVYNRSTEQVSTLSLPPYSITVLIGFDPSSSLRMYSYCAECQNATFGAYSILTKSYLWTVQLKTQLSSIWYNSFTDTVDIAYTDGPVLNSTPYLARYGGATGKLLWSKQTGARGSPANYIALTLTNGNLLYQLQETSTFACRNEETGDLLWNSTLPGNAYSSVEDIILFAYDETVPTVLYAVNSSTGQLLWNSSAPAKLACFVAPPYASILLDNSTATPKYGFVATCILNSTRDYILVVDARHGTLLFTRTVDAQAPIASIVTISANIYYASDTNVYKWNPTLEQTSRIWTSELAVQALMIDSDGSLLAAPLIRSGPANATLISPHLH